MVFNVVCKNLKLLILPDADMIGVLEQNIGNARFIWNKLLTGYNELYKMFKFHGYRLNPTIKNLNVMLNLLKKDYPFLNEVESPRSSRFLGVIIPSIVIFLFNAMFIELLTSLL